MKVLILASSSFAATGLVERLAAEGHEVWTFNRSATAQAGPRDLSGSYSTLQDKALTSMSGCDVLINYAIVKNGSIEENIAQADIILAAASALAVKRFIHISSISVLPSISGTATEETPSVEARWKGVYSRIKAAVETHIIDRWKSSELDIVRPGFILAPGLVDSMVGTGMKLPTGHVLGLGVKRTVIMLVHRDAVNQALVRIVGLPFAAAGEKRSFMLVAPNAPRRQEYLDFQCRELGRGWRTLHFPGWFWRASLACASPLLSLLKRRRYRLVKLFEHNLNVREYDCTQTERALGVDMRFDWQAALRELVRIKPSPPWPEGQVKPAAPAQSLAYHGMGRIVTQKHLPGLARAGFKGQISWSDPALSAPPQHPGLAIASSPGIAPDATHAVIAAPWAPRAGILDSLPAGIQHVLLEKPFAVSTDMFTSFQSKLAGRSAAVLHNYRFKPNVLRLREHLRQHPSGALRGVTLHYETPSPANEQSAWMKQELRHRVLLTDYAMHFLDLAWLFCQGDMRVHRCDITTNDRQELETVSAALSFGGVPCDILIRSGCHQRQCLIAHHFQNYTTQLRFFPDVFVPVVGGHGMLDDARLAWGGLKNTAMKVAEKLGVATADRSHDQVLAAFVGQGDPAVLAELSIEALTPFYQRLTQLADIVYPQAQSSLSSAQ